MNKYKTQEINKIDLTYRPNVSLTYFETIKNEPWAMLLRSPSNEHSDSRFDIMVANPIVRILTEGGQTTVIEPDGHYKTLDDPFDVLSRVQNQYLPEIDHTQWSEFPFIGGALGYFSYDLGRWIETIPSIATNDINLPDMAVGLYQWALVVDHQKKEASIIGVNPNSAQQWLDSLVPLTNTVADFAIRSPWVSNMTQSEYKDRFNAIQHYLRTGDCYQVNLTQRFTADYTGCEWQAYKQLEHQNKAPFSGFLRYDNYTIISISPERFIRVIDQNIETKPIKGTKPRSSNKDEDAQLAEALAQSEKDQAENLMIVDLLRNDIGKVAKPGSVTVPKLFAIESFPAVHHLVSTVVAKLDTDKTTTDLLKASFPGGSITGAPKIRAMQIIEELEPHRRSIYCGSIGYISRHGRMDTSITIRTLIAKDNTLYVWAGGGIVADSQADSEYQETYDKLSKILPVLSISN